VSFLALIIAVLADAYLDLGAKVRRDGWYSNWAAVLEGLGLTGGAAIACAVLLPLVVVGLVLQILESLLFGLPWIAAAAVLLLYSFGRLDSDGLQEQYRAHLRRGDFQGAWLELQQALPELGEIAPELDEREVHQVVQRVLLYQAYQRWFPVLFYFLVFGPLGALGYRLCQFAVAGRQDALVITVLDWVPARLLAATFTLTGNFTASVDELWDALRAAGMPPAEVLWTVAEAAVEAPSAGDDFSGVEAARENETQAALVRRAAVSWVVVVAVLVILG